MFLAMAAFASKTTHTLAIILEMKLPVLNLQLLQLHHEADHLILHPSSHSKDRDIFYVACSFVLVVVIIIVASTLASELAVKR